MTTERPYDPFAPHRGAAERRPRRSTADDELPPWLFDALRERGVPDEAFAPLTTQFEQLNRAERAATLAELQSHRQRPADLDELAQALVAFHEGRDPDAQPDDDLAGVVQAMLDTGEPAQVAAAHWYQRVDVDVRDETVEQLDEIAAWLDEQEDPAAAYDEMSALVGDDGPHKVAEYDAAIAGGLSHDDAVALVWHTTSPGDAGDDGTGGDGTAQPEAVTSTSDDESAGSGDADGSQPGDSTVADVPKGANEVIRWIDDGESDDEKRARAGRALAVELDYPSMRKSVRQVLDDVLGDDVVRAAIDERG